MSDEFKPGIGPCPKYDMGEAVKAAYVSGNFGGGRLDAGEAQYFTRMLTEVNEEVLGRDFPDMIGRSIVPLKTSNEGAEAFTEREKETVGRVALIKNYADDLPSVSGYKSERAFGFAAWGDSYHYSVQDLRAARMAGSMSLDAEDAVTAREVIEQKIDQAIFLGEPSLSGDNFKGLAKQSNITPVVSGVDWATATPAQMLADFENMYASILTDTKGVIRRYGGGKLIAVMAPAEYAAISKKRNLSAGDGYDSVKNLVLANSPWLEDIMVTPWLEGAGTASKNRVIFMPRDERILYTKIPIDFYQHAPQARNLAFVINCESRFGGVVIRKNKMIRYLDMP